MMNFFTVCWLDTSSQNLNSDFTLKNCLFESVKLAKNTDPDKYAYSSCVIGFDSRSQFSLTDRSMGKNAIIFGVDMVSSVHIDNKKKDALTAVKGPIQGLVDTKLTAEA